MKAWSEPNGDSFSPQSILRLRLMRHSVDQPCMSHRTGLPTDIYRLQYFWTGGSRTEIVHIIFFLVKQRSLVGQDLLIIEALRSQSDTLHSVGLLWTNGRPDAHNTQHSQETEMHAPGRIRTHNPRKRAAADPHLRPRGHWELCAMIRQCVNDQRDAQFL